MSQLLESTRNYLKTSTKLGRRMSSYRDDSSASEASLQDLTPVNVNVETLKQQPQPHRRPSKNRLSTLFSLESLNRNSVSSEDGASMSQGFTRKFGRKEKLEQQQQQQQSLNESNKDSKKKRRTSGSQKSTHSSLLLPSPAPSEHRTSSIYDSHDEGQQAIAATQVRPRPRVMSPALSATRSDHSSGSRSSTYSSYDTRPDDYPSMSHYQAHIWRRTLLEDSIMHSLKLGLSEPRAGSGGRKRSSARSSSRMSRDHQAALVAAATGNEGLPSPNGSSVRVVERGMTGPATGGPTVHHNSPYQMVNSSTTNITHSYASFTLELPEHQVPHVMNASAVPNLFSIKRLSGGANASRFLHTGPSPSPRVLTGKAGGAVAISKENMDPRHLPQPVVAAV